jgi:hypothetical protein
VTALPETLQELLQRAQAAVERHPQHDLNLGYRQAIGRACGPHRDSGLPGSVAAHRRRARLAILTVRRVLPLWEACFPGDERSRRILEMAEGVLRGEILPEDADENAARFWDDLDALQPEFGPEKAPMALAVGYAAASALVAAYGEAWDDLDVEEIDYESVDSRDFTCNDTAFYASIAYAGGPVWEILARVSPDAERRRAFWTWWLTEAVPLAWEAG